ncbi:MAG: class I SAM-dependent methyltransferase [Alphaproteobacteria bacterium]|nr:class I SAM-dependent methyltransferase [Alphaproteobacteria bacterium]
MAAKSSDHDTVDFGARSVRRAAKRGLVDAVFSRVAPRYDVMNDLMSGGIHRMWKAALVDRLAPRPGMKVLDVAGGTGDIAFRAYRRSQRQAIITVCDINTAMLAIGRDRALDRGIVDGIAWLCGDAEALPIARSSVDAYTIAFGIRNVTDIAAALVEACRVLKPGGHFLCLEFSRVAIPGLDRLYEAYSEQVLPRLGAAVAGDRDAYRYLVDSIRRFPAPAQFSAMIGAAGLGQVRHRNLSGGIAALHSAWRL